MTDDFVRKVTDHLKRENEQARLQNEKSVLDAKTINAHAPEQWHALREWIKQFCDNGNREMGSTSFSLRTTQNTQLIVDAKTERGNRVLQATFHEDTNFITYSVGGTGGKFSPVVSGGGFGFSDGSNAVSVEEMGRILVKTLLDMR